MRYYRVLEFLKFDRIAIMQLRKMKGQNITRGGRRHKPLNFVGQK